MNLHDYIEKNTPLGLFRRINVFQEYNPDIHDIEQRISKLKRLANDRKQILKIFNNEEKLERDIKLKILQLERILNEYKLILEILNDKDELAYYKKKKDKIPSREALKMRGMSPNNLDDFKNNLKPTY